MTQPTLEEQVAILRADVDRLMEPKPPLHFDASGSVLSEDAGSLRSEKDTIGLKAAQAGADPRPISRQNVASGIMGYPFRPSRLRDLARQAGFLILRRVITALTPARRTGS